MTENPHVRPIHIFSPKDELRIDDADPRRRPATKRSANPVAGLLDEADTKEAAAEAPREPARPGGARPAETRPVAGSAGSAGSAGGTGQGQASVESGAGPLLGDMPEVIEGDFPDPIDV